MMLIKNLVYQLILPFKDVIQSRKIIRYYEERWGGIDDDLKELITYIKKTHKVRTLNYPFVEKYDNMLIDVKKDNINGRYFVIHNGRAMYFSKKMQSREEVARYYRGIIEEQDMESPHRYLTKTFSINTDDVVVDAGTAEGNFALDVLPMVSKLILVECEKEWAETLRVTFQKEIKEGKVVVVNKFLGNRDDGRTVTLDSLYEKYGKIDFVKMDIEGAEQSALYGGERLLRESGHLKLAVCTYHTPEAYGEITEILKDYKLTHTKRYMVLNPWFGWRAPYARRGVVRAKK